MRLRFASGGRTIEIDGSGESDASFISVSGLEGVAKSYQTVKYVSLPGQVTLSESVLPREIVVTGDICLNGSMPFSDYCTFFADCGEMYVFRGTSRKKISYKPVHFKQTGKKGDFIMFELKIICDFPYFSDYVNNCVDIYKRINKVTGTFQLPKVFTERETSADVINKGQVASEPLIVLEYVEGGTFSEGIHITNQSTGQKLVLLTNMLRNERIILDIKNRSISSNRRVNCYGILSDKYALSEFLLQKGVNSILIENKNSGETVKVRLYFDNLYTEAM